jgi:WD40 repeat protein
MLVGVVNATYNEQGKQPCDEDTRVDILADIRTWVYDTSENSQSFLWLTGDPGSGKSAITASVARECKDAGILWAQFFINRNNADTTDPRSYFPSIARQLVDHIPDSDVALAIHDALKRKRTLVDDISAEQASRLFIDAIEIASKQDPERPVVVVIDGMDETTKARLRFTAGIFSELFAKLCCGNAKVFISSRTEDDIQKPFYKAFDVKHVKHIHLDPSTDSSIMDVSNFLGRRIGEIVEDNDLNWEEWPGKQRMQALCSRASGLFIWAATVAKFFQEQIEALGRECLNDLLDAVSTEGMGDINALYDAILRLVYKGRTHAWEYETFRRVVGCIVVLQEPLCLAEIKDLLNLRQDASSERVDIEHFVRRLRTVLVAGTDGIDGQTVPRLHKSFFEFITSERVDRRFRVDPDKSNSELAIQCVRQLASVKDKRTTLCHPDRSALAVGCLPVGLAYSIQFGLAHLSQAEGVISGIAIMDNTLKLPELQKLLRISSNDLSCSRPLSVNLSPDRTRVAVSWDKTIYLWDRSKMRPINRSIQCHSSIVMSVAFSPDGKRVVSGSRGGTVCLWDSCSGQPIQPFQGHTEHVWSVVFSPDGKRIASCSADHTARIWDSQSGQPIGPPFRCHSREVNSLAFSPDGKRIVTGSDDRTVSVWDSESGGPIGLPFRGHTGWVRSVSFSPDGKRIISGSDDHTIRIWDEKSGLAIEPPSQGHTGGVKSVAFSPDGKRVISGSDDKTLRMWDAHSGKLIGLPFEGHTDSVRSVSFSPDGKRIISGSDDHTIRIWDPQNRQTNQLPFQGHTGGVNSVAFSPDGKRVISGSDDKTVRMWDSQYGKPIGPPFQNDNAGMCSIAFSPTDTYIISISLDEAVQFWDLQTGLPIESSLEGHTKDLISTTISSDGRRIAAVSLNGTVYLWDATTHQFASPPIESSIDGFKSLTFSSGGARLILSGVDGSSRVWNAANGKPLDICPPSEPFLCGNNEVMSFDMKEGRRSGSFENALLQWFPSHNPNAGLWVYIDGKVISNRGGDSVTIIDMNDIVSERISVTSLKS